MENTRNILIKKILAEKEIDMKIIDTWSINVLRNTLDILLEKKEQEKWERVLSCLVPFEDVGWGVNGQEDIATYRVLGEEGNQWIDNRRRGY